MCLISTSDKTCMLLVPLPAALPSPRISIPKKVYRRDLGLFCHAVRVPQPERMRLNPSCSSSIRNADAVIVAFTAVVLHPDMHIEDRVLVAGPVGPCRRIGRGQQPDLVGNGAGCRRYCTSCRLR